MGASLVIDRQWWACRSRTHVCVRPRHKRAVPLISGHQHPWSWVTTPPDHLWTGTRHHAHDHWPGSKPSETTNKVTDVTHSSRAGDVLMRGTTRREAVEVFRRRGAGPVVHRPALHDTAKRALRWKQETSTLSIGIDVGKAEHRATALDSAGKTLFDKILPSNEPRLRDLYKHLAEHGRVLVVVDQPATIGALAVAVAQDMGVTVGYLPGLSMRRIADLSPGNAKTDARHAAVIAQAAATLPHTLRDVTTTDEEAAALTMLTGFDLDLARQVNQTANRIRGLYTQIHPALETVLSPRLEHDAILETIATWPTPTTLKKAGKARIAAKLNKHTARAHTF